MSTQPNRSMSAPAVDGAKVQGRLGAAAGADATELMSCRPQPEDAFSLRPGKAGRLGHRESRGNEGTFPTAFYRSDAGPFQPEWGSARESESGPLQWFLAPWWAGIKIVVYLAWLLAVLLLLVFVGSVRVTWELGKTVRGRRERA